MEYGGWLRPWMVACALALGALFFVVNHPRPVRRDPGVLAGPAPVQVSLPEHVPPILVDGFTLVPRATYHIEARILGAEHYSFDKLASIVPVDLAVGWGRMSDTAVLDHFQIEQDNRFYHYRWKNPPPIPPDEIIRSSANMHLISADSAVAKTIRHAHEGQIITLDGDLVDVTSPNGQYVWSTSLTREDTGAGACEIMLVTTAEVR